MFPFRGKVSTRPSRRHQFARRLDLEVAEPRVLLAADSIGLAGPLIAEENPSEAALIGTYSDGANQAAKEPHVDWINVDSISLGIDRPFGRTFTPTERNTATLQDLTTTKESDKAIPKLTESILSGTVHDKVIIDFIAASPINGQEPVYYEIELEKARVTSYSISGSTETAASETLSMNYDKIKWNYLEIDGFKNVDLTEWTETVPEFRPGKVAQTDYNFERSHRQLSEMTSYVITSIQHLAHEPTEYEHPSSDGEYTNTFTCLPSAVIFRPARTTNKPFVPGTQIAEVVGERGEEIDSDEYGRIRIQFRWSTDGRANDNSSCWIRVSQVHAGKTFGGIDIPRIGHEQLVDFLHGDPDQPVIRGRVYNSEATTPYGLPEGKVQSGVHSSSASDDAGYNEFVLDDTNGSELIHIHGQYDKDTTIEFSEQDHVDRGNDATNNETPGDDR